VPRNLQFRVIRDDGLATEHRETHEELDSETQSETQEPHSVAQAQPERRPDSQHEFQMESQRSTWTDSLHRREDLATRAYLQKQVCNQFLCDVMLNVLA
jgi:hypothetical protein